MDRREFFRPGFSRSGVPASNAQDSRVIALASSASPGSRRGFLQLVGGTVLASLTGCASMHPLWKPRCELDQDFSMADLVRHLNSNIDQINAWNCNDVSISAHGAKFRTPKLSAKMTVERPRNFRLTADALGHDMVELGSNEERFWYWMKGEEGVLTARHDQMEAVQQQLPIPFEPDWLIEALGVIPLDESEIEFEKHPTEPRRVFFKRQRQAPDGTPVELVSTVDTCQGVIVEHSLVNRRGDIIALAKLSEHLKNGRNKNSQSTDPVGLTLPHTVELEWPKAQMGLTLRMGAIIINPKSIPKQMFVMTDRKCPVFDLGSETGEMEQTAMEEPQPRAPRRGGKARL